MPRVPGSPSRVHRVAAGLIEALWLTAVVLVPLAVNPWGYNHELHKVALFRGLTLLMAAAHVLALAWAPQPPDPRRWLRRPLVRPILLVAGVALLSALTSVSPVLSLWGPYYGRRGAYLLLSFVLWALLVAAYLRTSAQRRRLATAAGIAGSLVALTPFVIAVAPFAEVLRKDGDLLTGRPGGVLINPIFLGAYLITTIPFTLAKVVGSLGNVAAPSKRRRQTFARIAKVAGWGAALALQVFVLLIAQSRGPWVGALVGLALFAALVLWPIYRRLVLAGLATGALLTSVLLVGLNFGLVPLSRLHQLPYVGRVAAAADLSQGTTRVRVVLWQAAWEVVTTWPQVGLEPDRLHTLRPLIGYGPEAAVFAYNLTYRPEMAHIEDPNIIWDRSHNETLDLLAMQGWLGLAATVLLGVVCVRQGLALWRAARSPIERVWVAAPLAALVAHVVETQFAFPIAPTAMMAWLCVAWLATPPSPLPPPSESGRELGVGEGRRWRVYAVVGALLLVLIAVRLEGGAMLAGMLAGHARALNRIGKWGESVELYDRALDIIPWQAAYHQFRAEPFYNLARTLPEDQAALRAELLEAADRSLARARQLAPLQLEYYSNAGIVHAYWSEAIDPAHLETAVAFYQQTFRLAPTRAVLRTDLGHIYHNHALYSEALEQYRIALEVDPQFATAYYDSGLAWLALDRPDLARQAFQAALELSPDCDACQDALEGLEERSQ